jgi:hypothetical protein
VTGFATQIPALQLALLPQPPQLSVPPQPSPAPPHSTPSDWQLSGTHTGGGGGVTGSSMQTPLVQL